MSQHPIHLSATAIAPANIAFSKYWGKIDSRLNIPYNDSVSMNLDAVTTKTTVTFSSSLNADSVVLNDKRLVGEELDRVIKHVAVIRSRAKTDLFAVVVTHNSFPTGAGIASSASGFAALTVAATSALNLQFSQRELSCIARLGSGSASRSIPDGFVRWNQGNSDGTSFAESVFPASHWSLHDVIAVIDAKKKGKSSTFGHGVATTSPLFFSRVEWVKKITTELLQAIEKRDIEKFGTLVEQEALCLHAVMMTSNPSIFYWLPGTVDVLHAVRELRSQGVPAYSTIDAGPNVHVICEEEYVPQVLKRLSEVPSVQECIDATVSAGARVL